ncbi:MAG: HNH endonuclease signature motif containing protein [Usitatibacter sp.]
MKHLAAIAFAVAIAFSGHCDAKGSRGHASDGYLGHSHSSRAAPGVPRDSHGKIARSGRARGEFKKSHPCPSTGRSSGGCPGYVIDHVTPLKRGGADAPGNMQWQTKAAAKEKDKWE